MIVGASSHLSGLLAAGSRLKTVGLFRTDLGSSVCLPTSPLIHHQEKVPQSLELIAANDQILL